MINEILLNAFIISFIGYAILFFLVTSVIVFMELIPCKDETFLEGLGLEKSSAKSLSLLFIVMFTIMIGSSIYSDYIAVQNDAQLITTISQGNSNILIKDNYLIVNSKRIKLTKLNYHLKTIKAKDIKLYNKIIEELPTTKFL